MPTGLLIYECGPLWLYKSGVHASDPRLLLVDAKGQAHLLASPLEFADYKGVSSAVIYGYGEAEAWCKTESVTYGWVGMVRFLMAKGGVDAVEVDAGFGALYLEKLREAGVAVSIAARNPFFAEMVYLRADEVEKLRAAQDLASSSIELGRSLIAAAEVRARGELYLAGQPLTSERVQGEMNAHAAGLGALEFHGGPIVACGHEAGIPHARGSGILRAGETIVMDCFPRHANYYWGDCTRTYVKGEPTAWQRGLVEAVMRVQADLCAMIAPGKNGGDVQTACEQAFADMGYETGEKDGDSYGFTHSVGHHVGLDLRGPGARTLTREGGDLAVGHAVTVEPGLYYPIDINGGIGGCRIEDVVVVTEDGHKNLTAIDKDNWVVG